MSIEQSERIRAALLRSKTSRQSSASPALETIEHSDAAPFQAAETEDDSTIFGKRAASAESPTAIATEAREASEPEETRKVEETLPLFGPSKNLESSRAPAREEAEQSRSKFKRNILIACGGAALAGLSLFLVWGPGRKSSQPSESVASVPLRLNVEAQGNGIIDIRWNTQSAAVTQAREGRMVITERGQQPRIISLGAEQLKIGHLYYQSPVDRVEFRLEVVQLNGAVAKESILALSSGLAAAPEAGPPVAPGPAQPAEGKKETAPTQPPPNAEAGATTPRIEKTVAPPASRPVARPFTPPSLERKGEETRVVVLDAPAAVSGGPVVAPVSLPPVALPENAAPRIAPPPVKDASQSKQIRVGGNLEAANLIKKVPPVYPPMARSMGLQGTVRFTATIGKDGAIQNLQVLSGHPMLVSAASDAVKKWIYKPTLLNGEPVEVITQIDVNFNLGK